jgi:hypothetical protein
VEAALIDVGVVPVVPTGCRVRRCSGAGAVLIDTVGARLPSVAAFAAIFAPNRRDAPSLEAFSSSRWVKRLVQQQIGTHR